MQDRVHYVIYCSEEEEEGYISGTRFSEQLRYLLLTKLDIYSCPDDVIPFFASQIAKIKTYTCKQLARKTNAKYSLCANITDTESLMIRKLNDREGEVITRCRNAVKDGENLRREFQKIKDR